jgi:hypothetical protein
MTKQLSIAAALVLAMACKTESAAPGAKAPEGDSTTKARSAKIEVKPVPPALPEAPQAGDPPASVPRSENRRGDGDRDEWRQRREARREARIDIDGDGTVSDEERAAVMQDRLAVRRTRLDTNGDGRLTPDELASAPGRMRIDDPAAIDTNRDGDISTDELAAAMKARRDQRRQDRAGSAATP